MTFYTFLPQAGGMGEEGATCQMGQKIFFPPGWPSMPTLVGEIPLSECRNGFADGFIGSEWV